MKRLTFLLCCFFHGFAATAQGGYDITVEVKPYTGTYVYLGYYYGKVRAMADSALLDGSSRGRFKGPKALNGGIYFIVSPTKQVLFELLVDKDQHFSLKADSADLYTGVTFSGSPLNAGFQQYSGFAGTTGKEIQALNGRYASARTAGDSAAIAARIRELGSRLQRFRDSIGRSEPGSFLATLFNAMNEPQIPPASAHPGGKYDSNFVYHYFKNHFWDGIAFDDERLVRTPFFEPKLEKYYQDLVSPHPDSLIREIDRMLLYSRTAPEMYRFLMVHFVQKYINPRYMGQDAVFVHLFEKYINAGKAEFFTPQYKEFTTKRAYSLMANLIGRPAAPLDMADTAGRALPLYALKGPFTVVCFWDPACSHCREVVPRLDSIFQAKWKKQGVQLYGVKVDGTRNDWIAFIREKKLTGWKHVHELPEKQEAAIKEGIPGYKQLYDVYQTPVLYLLDRDKRIIAKKLTYLQIDEVIDAKLKGQKT